MPGEWRVGECFEIELGGRLWLRGRVVKVLPAEVLQIAVLAGGISNRRSARWI
jgi:hypothetical protein